jgi:Haem-binding uptake, Tiki superfamily, ChaN
MTQQHLPTLFKLLAILLVTGASLGCTALAPQPQPQPIRDVAARLQALPPLDALLLGEQHDNPDHPRIHREVIEDLAQRGALSAVVLEMASQGGSTQGLVSQVLSPTEN